MAIVSKVEVTTKRTQTITLSADEVAALVKKHIVENYNVFYKDISIRMHTDDHELESVRAVVETIEIKEED